MKYLTKPNNCEREGEPGNQVNICFICQMSNQMTSFCLLFNIHFYIWNLIGFALLAKNCTFITTAQNHMQLNACDFISLNKTDNAKKKRCRFVYAAET